MKAKIGFILVSAAAMLALAEGQQLAGGHHGPPMDEKTKAAFEACKSETQDNPGREAMQQCLSAKGVTMPEHHRGGHGGPRGERPPDESSTGGTAN